MPIYYGYIRFNVFTRMYVVLCIHLEFKLVLVRFTLTQTFKITYVEKNTHLFIFVYFSHIQPMSHTFKRTLRKSMCFFFFCITAIQIFRHTHSHCFIKTREKNERIICKAYNKIE